MQSLKDKLYEAMVTESADKVFKSLFGQPIVYGSKVLDKLNKLGLNDDHKYDKFIVLDDGTVTYTNSKRLIEVTAKIHPSKLNRIVKPDEVKALVKIADTAASTFDICAKPYHLFRAILNSLTIRSYHATPTEIVLDDIDYTAGDFAKDKTDVA